MNPRPSLDELEARFAAREPTLQAFLPEEDRFGRLRREMDELLAAYPDPARRPALFGLPVGIKDIFHVKGFPTGAGSRLPSEELAGEEGPAVAALRRHGALIVGKTVSTEFAYFAPGPTRNPFDPERTPGGSSSGSAAAVAAGLCALALGTQTIGSINRPAAFCGVVGFKPTYGRISTDGVIALAPSFDHVGFLAQDVRTAALGMAALCEDWRPVEPERRPVLGIPGGPYLAYPSGEGSAHFRATCERLEEAGYEVRSVPAMEDFDEIVARHRRVMAAETARVHRDWFPRFRNLYAPQTVELIERGQGVPPDEVERGRAGRERLRRELAEAMDAHGIDLWISPPALGPAPRGLGNTGDPIMNLPWTHAGVPTLGVPAGRSAEGLPMGLQIAGRFGEDAALLAWGIGLEKVLEA